MGKSYVRGHYRKDGSYVEGHLREKTRIGWGLYKRKKVEYFTPEQEKEMALEEMRKMLRDIKEHKWRIIVAISCITFYFFISWHLY